MDEQPNITQKTAPAPPKVNGHAVALPSDTYSLTEREHISVRALHETLLKAKAEAYTAIEAVKAAENLWNGASHVLIIARGWERAEFSPDLSKLVRK